MTRSSMLGAALLLAILAGCTRTGSPENQPCDGAANDDPAVKELMLKSIGNPYFLNNNQDALAAARQDARLACLRSRGLIPRGGVERQKPL